MTHLTTEYLIDVVRRAEQAGHGNKMGIYEHAAEQLGISLQTLMRRLAGMAPAIRRRRSDAGNSTLTRDEAKKISAYMLDSRRKNGKRLASLEDAVEVLRSNGEIIAARPDESTGELVPLSLSAVARALYHYNLHPEQLARPAPKSRLRSLHPNHVWQIDPSLCVLYYLPAQSGQALQVMREDVYYKNKPANIRKIEKERVWRYVITDHASGVIFVHYVLGAESGINLVNAFIHAAHKRDGDPFHGVPRMVMVDPGSANTGAVFRNLCRAMGITLQVNKPGQPWAKGQVEKANDIVETSFEHRLKFQDPAPATLAEINELAGKWMRWYNGTRIHSRTGKTRYGVWQTITAEQLILAPDAQVMRDVAFMAPQPRVVTAQLSVPFNGRTYSVADIPQVMVGETLLITRNPWREDVAGILYKDADGKEAIQLVEAIKLNEYGFDASAPLVGEEYHSPADTQADTHRKEVERFVMGAQTDAEAEASRKAGATPFAGRLDPMKPITDTTLPDYLPRRGTELELTTPRVQALRLNHVEAARRLRAELGDDWSGEHYAWLVQRHPEGVAEDDLPAIAATLRRQPPAPLRALGGE